MNWLFVFCTIGLAVVAFQSAEAQSIVPVLPIDNVLYYLYHIESGQYVQIDGGSSNPPQGASLLFWSPEQKLSDEFQFQTINGHRQLQQFSSGMYVNPMGGTVGNQVPLVLWHAIDDNRTSINMISSNGYTYLVKGDESPPVYYAHPNGGSDNPPNGDVLVFFNAVRPGVAIGILPAETFTITSIDFTGNMDGFPQQAYQAENSFTNNSPQQVNAAITVGYTGSVTNTFTSSFTESIGIKISESFTAGIGFASSTVSFEFSFNFAETQTKSTSTTDGVSLSTTVNVPVPPMSSTKVTMTTTLASGNLPFTATAIDYRGVEVSFSGTVDVKYWFNQFITIS